MRTNNLDEHLNGVLEMSSRIYESVYFHDEGQHNALKEVLRENGTNLSAVMKELLPSLIESLHTVKVMKRSIEIMRVTT